MSRKIDKPTLIDGFKGFFLEIFYITYTKYCDTCGAKFNGYYCREFMNYCHHCGDELVEQ